MTDPILDDRLELERVISTREAARLRGVSEDTFLRNYKHLIRKLQTFNSQPRSL
jgi:hypothetical protein